MRNYALIDTTGTILPGDLARMVEAANALIPTLTDAWDLAPISGVVVDTATFNASKTNPNLIPQTDIQFRFVGDDSNVPGALGFHDESSGIPYAELLINPILQNGGGVLDGGAASTSLASVFFHELAETACDEYVSSWILMPSGKLIALESADPVEGNLVEIKTSDGTSVFLSDFVYPRYFDAQAPTDGSVRLSYLETVKAPFALGSGGYQIIFDPSLINSPNGPISNVFGARMPSWMRSLKSIKSRNRARLARTMPPKFRSPEDGYCHCGWRLVNGSCSKPAGADTEPKPHVIVIPPPPPPVEVEIETYLCATCSTCGGHLCEESTHERCADPSHAYESTPIALPPEDETDLSPAARMFMTDDEVERASTPKLPDDE